MNTIAQRWTKFRETIEPELAAKRAPEICDRYDDEPVIPRATVADGLRRKTWRKLKPWFRQEKTNK